MHPNNPTPPNRQPNPDDDVRLRLVESMLRGEERDVNVTDIQLLDEIEMCSSTERTERTRADYRRLQEHFVCFLAGHGAKLDTAKQKHARFFIAHLAERSVLAQRLAEKCSFCQAHGSRAEGYSPTYIKRHLSAIAAAYEYLVREGIAVADPTHGLKRPRVRATRQYVPTVDEVKALLAYRGTARSRLVVRWAYFAPARRSEHVATRWSDIDEFARWHLTAKGDKAHSFKLHPEVLRALRAYREHQQREARRHPAMARALADPQTAYVFMTKAGKPMSGGQFVRVLKRHAVRAGVAVTPAAGKQWDAIDGMTSRLSPHALRRAWATHSLNDPVNPVSLEVVTLVLGHDDTRTTQEFYARTDGGRGDVALDGRRL